MKKLENPFIGTENYTCFGCAPDSQTGLRLEFFLEEETEEVVTFWEPELRFAGYSNVVHGGVQASILDETFGWLLFSKGKTGVTVHLNVTYRKPFQISGGKIKVRTRLKSLDNKNAVLEGEIIKSDGTVLTSAEGTFRILPERIAHKMVGKS